MIAMTTNSSINVNARPRSDVVVLIGWFLEQCGECLESVRRTADPRLDPGERPLRETENLAQRRIREIRDAMGRFLGFCLKTPWPHEFMRTHPPNRAFHSISGFVLDQRLLPWKNTRALP
jgi:hypothetical protein